MKLVRLRPRTKNGLSASGAVAWPVFGSTWDDGVNTSYTRARRPSLDVYDRPRSSTQARSMAGLNRSVRPPPPTTQPVFSAPMNWPPETGRFGPVCM